MHFIYSIKTPFNTNADNINNRIQYITAGEEEFRCFIKVKVAMPPYNITDTAF